MGRKVVGAAWSLQELRKLLVREGFPEDMDLAECALISWRGAGSDTWPDSTSNRRLTAVTMAAGLIGSAIFLTIVGSEDAFGALTFASQVTGFFIFLAGMIQVLSAFAVKDYWDKRTVKYSGLTILVGVFIALVVHSALILLWCQEMDATLWVFTYMPLWVWSLVAVWIIVRERVWRGTPYPKQVTAGVLATTLLAGVNFLYSTAYKPYAEHVQISFTAKFGKPQLDQMMSVAHVPVTFSLRNTGKVPIYVIANTFAVHGRVSNFVAGNKKLERKREDAERKVDSELYAQSPEYRQIMNGLVVAPGTSLGPGTGQVDTVDVQVPKEAVYESLEVDGFVTVLRKDRGEINTADLYPLHSWKNGETDMFSCPPKHCGEDYVLHMTEMTHTNNIINVTRRQRYVVAVRYLDLGSMGAFVSPLNSQGMVSSDFEPAETYGVETYLTGTDTIPFATILNATR
ncbi:hypothetical protein ACPCVO_45160 [Streptomyces umbrinus]|uniref:hypothetical protein n=1 Tax=Streptomyces umbrinus TaxID=67370 RepID=UPI003C2AF135